MPTYQRGLVWPDDRKADLIESLYEGYPIGALLLSDQGDQDGVRVYSLIDGLQRTSTVVEHLEQPLTRAPAAMLPEGEMIDVMAVLEAECDMAGPRELVQDAILSWLRQTRVLKAADGYDWTKLLEQLTSEFALTPPDDPDRVRVALASLLDKIAEKADISGMQIPVLIFSGPQERLPEIFDRLNSQGTALTKYQVFAASWVEDETLVENADIRNAINQRYAAFEQDGLIVERDPGEENVFSLFEYLFGLSRVLASKYPRLFPQSKSITDNASAAFQLAPLLLGKQLSSMPDLPDYIAPKDANGRLDIRNFETVVFFAADHVDRALQPFLGLRLTQEPSSPAHGELQLVSLMASVAALRYASLDSLEERPTWVADRDSLSEAIPQHYLFDILLRTWRGPTYSLAYQRVWSEGSPSRHYAEALPRSTIESSLQIWFNEQLSKRNDKRPNVSSSEKLFLKFVYSDVVSVADQGRYEFDVEHLFPVGRVLARWKEVEGEPWPIGCVANLALLDKSSNRRKRDETVPEYFTRGVDQNGPSAQEIETIKKWLFIDADSVSMSAGGGSDDIDLDGYRSFLENRWKRVTAALLRQLRVDDAS